jgi:hypothetical protein
LEIAMSIPVNALKDDELLHYAAALDPKSATKLSWIHYSAESTATV